MISFYNYAGSSPEPHYYLRVAIGLSILIGFLLGLMIKEDGNYVSSESARGFLLIMLIYYSVVGIFIYIAYRRRSNKEESFIHNYFFGLRGSSLRPIAAGGAALVAGGAGAPNEPGFSTLFRILFTYPVLAFLEIINFLESFIGYAYESITGNKYTSDTTESFTRNRDETPLMTRIKTFKPELNKSGYAQTLFGLLNYENTRSILEKNPITGRQVSSVSFPVIISSLVIALNLLIPLFAALVQTERDPNRNDETYSTILSNNYVKYLNPTLAITSILFLVFIYGTLRSYNDENFKKYKENLLENIEGKDYSVLNKTKGDLESIKIKINNLIQKINSTGGTMSNLEILDAVREAAIPVRGIKDYTVNTLVPSATVGPGNPSSQNDRDALVAQLRASAGVIQGKINSEEYVSDEQERAINKLNLSKYNKFKKEYEDNNKEKQKTQSEIDNLTLDITGLTNRIANIDNLIQAGNPLEQTAVGISVGPKLAAYRAAVAGGQPFEQEKEDKAKNMDMDKATKEIAKQRDLKFRLEEEKSKKESKKNNEQLKLTNITQQGVETKAKLNKSRIDTVTGSS